MRYYIKGKTYPAKGSLTNWGCWYDGEKKCFETGNLGPQAEMHVKQICDKHNLEMTPIVQPKTELGKKIKGILGD